MRFELRWLGSEHCRTLYQWTTRASGRKCLRFSGLSWVVTVTFQNIAACKLLFFVKKQRTMERKKRSKGRGWESCYVKNFYGTFGVEIRSYGQKLVKLCTHTHTHTRASPIVV